MSYSKLLQQIMKQKSLTATEIIERCKEYGIEISEAYFSRIKNNKKNPPSEEISRAIAKACDVDERLLVIEGYIDKSPKEIQEFFSTINFMAKSAGAKMLKLIQKGDIKKLQKLLEDEPVSDTIIELINEKKNYIKFLEENFIYERLGNGRGLSFLLKEHIGFDINDDAMYPILKKGDKVEIEQPITSYSNSDILLVKQKNSKKQLARYVHNVNNTRILVPVNKEYKQIICDKEDLIIIGRINNLIRKV